MLQNPNAYATPRLEARHEELMAYFRKTGRMGIERRAELWRIEKNLNRRTRPVATNPQKP